MKADLAALRTEPWLARLLATADAVVEDLGPGALEAAGLGPDVLERENPRLVLLRISPFGQTGPLRGRARRRSHRAGVLRRAVRDRLSRPPADSRHRAARGGVDGHPRRERAPDGDLPRAPERSRAGRRSRPLRDGAAHAGGRGRSLRPDGRGDDAHGHRVAHRRPRQRLPRRATADGSPSPAPAISRSRVSARRWRRRTRRGIRASPLRPRASRTAPPPTRSSPTGSRSTTLPRWRRASPPSASPARPFAPSTRSSPTRT